MAICGGVGPGVGAHVGGGVGDGVGLFVGHGTLWHTRRCTSGHCFPLPEAATTTSTMRNIVPPPHDVLHGVQACQLCTQSTSQTPVPQSRQSLRACTGGQARPPCRERARTRRTRDCTPPPQIELQRDHAPQPDNVQSIGRGGVGCAVGVRVGMGDGDDEGCGVGNTVGLGVGADEGAGVGTAVGSCVGARVTHDIVLQTRLERRFGHFALHLEVRNCVPPPHVTVHGVHARHIPSQ